MIPRTVHARRLLPLAAVPLVLSACAGGSDAPEDDATPHGVVQGASQEPEAQLALVGVDPGGAVTALDLVSGRSQEIADVGPVEHVAADGRFVAAATADGVAVVDTGRWTVDHGDHVHYYLAEPRVAATLDGLEGPVAVASTETRTVVHAQGSRRVVVLDRAALGQGKVDEVGSFATDAVAVEPLGESLVLADDSGVSVVDADGETAGSPTPCTDPAGAVTTRVGVAVSCAEGAVLVTDPGADPEVVPYPDGTKTSDRATTLASRTSRPTVAGTAGGSGLWLLDTRERTWTLVETDRPLAVAVSVDDEDEHVVAVEEDGSLVVLTPDGEEVGRADVVAQGVDAPVVEVDAQRAYVPTADGSVAEIDFADSARVARTLDLGAPLVAEVG